MDSKQEFGTSGVANAPVYEDFDPDTEWAKEDQSSFDTLLVHLPGFLKDKLKIQITSAGKLRLSGERAVGQNKWRRFLKEFALSPDCDTKKITAKFEGGILYVKVPKSPLNTSTNNPPIASPSPTTTDQKPNPVMKPKPSPAPDQKPPQQQEAAAAKPASSSYEKQQSDASKAKAKDKEVAKKDYGDGVAETAVGSGNLDGPKPAKPAEKLAVGKTMSRLETYKKAIVQGFGSDQVKSPRALVNLVLAVLFVGVLALYVKNIFKSLGGYNYSNGTNNEHHEL